LALLFECEPQKSLKLLVLLGENLQRWKRLRPSGFHLGLLLLLEQVRDVEGVFDELFEGRDFTAQITTFLAVLTRYFFKVGHNRSLLGGLLVDEGHAPLVIDLLVAVVRQDLHAVIDWFLVVSAQFLLLGLWANLPNYLGRILNH